LNRTARQVGIGFAVPTNAITCTVQDWRGIAVSTKNSWPLEEFLAWTISVVDQKGFVSRKQSGKGTMATYNEVIRLMTKPPEDYPPELFGLWERLQVRFRPTSDHIADAKEIIEHLKGVSLNQHPKPSQWLLNARRIAIEGKVDENNAGIAASMVSYWL
jgi:hypothetical protein